MAVPFRFGIGNGVTGTPQGAEYNCYNVTIKADF
jgi:hypothetical protein